MLCRFSKFISLARRMDVSPTIACATANSVQRNAITTQNNLLIMKWELVRSKRASKLYKDGHNDHGENTLFLRQNFDMFSAKGILPKISRFRKVIHSFIHKPDIMQAEIIKL